MRRPLSLEGIAQRLAKVKSFGGGFKSQAQVLHFFKDGDLWKIGRSWVNQFGLNFTRLPKRLHPKKEGEK